MPNGTGAKERHTHARCWGECGAKLRRNVKSPLVSLEQSDESLLPLAAARQCVIKVDQMRRNPTFACANRTISRRIQPTGKQQVRASRLGSFSSLLFNKFFFGFLTAIRLFFFCSPETRLKAFFVLEGVTGNYVATCTLLLFSLSSNSLAIAELLTLFMYQKREEEEKYEGRVSQPAASQPAAREIFVRTSKLFVVLIGESK